MIVTLARRSVRTSIVEYDSEYYKNVRRPTIAKLRFSEKVGFRVTNVGNHLYAIVKVIEEMNNVKKYILCSLKTTKKLEKMFIFWKNVNTL